MLILRMLQKTLIVLFLLAGMQTAAGQQQDDPLYPFQWHLKNTEQNEGTPGEDINVEPVWNELVRGQGIYISIVDGDLQFDHPDLIENISTKHSVDYYPNTTDTGSHATSVAGVAAARGYNGIGVRGVAPWATIYSLNLLANVQQPSGFSNLELGDLLTAMTQNSTITAVSNNSWGPIRPFQQSVSHRTMWEGAVNTGITQGFYGKGTVYVWAAGNNHRSGIDHRISGIDGADNANYDAYSNHHASVTVCAVNYNGKHNGTSEFGANLWVCAPSRDDDVDPTVGIVTTSIPASIPVPYYTSFFSGTSAAAPMVSGVVALMRQANPDLSWRDVKLILANSARRNDPMDDNWEQGALKYDSFSGESEEKYYFNHKYGFGVVDAQKAVELAENWTNLPDRTTDTTVEDIVNIMKNDATTPIRRSLTVQSDINFIEYVDISVTFDIGFISEIRMELTSPAGTTSTLMTPAVRPVIRQRQENGFDGTWRFGSALHLGEDPSGMWKFELQAHQARFNGQSRLSITPVDLDKWELRIRGFQIKIDASPATGLSDLNINTTTMTLSLLGAKWKENLMPGDFRLKNAPAGLTIKKVAPTSDTQVVQLELELNEGFAEDYLFEVEATTGTVSSFAKPLASNSIQLVSNKQIIVSEDAAIPDGVIGSDYEFAMDNLFTSSQPLIYTISGTVPPGLRIDGSTLLGEPTTIGDYRLKVVATREDDGISRTAFFDFSILPYTFGVQIKVFLEGTVVPLVPLVNICDRTQRVITEILSHTGSSECEIVPENRLKSIRSLDFDRQRIDFLKEGDFSGLSELTFLGLSSNFLTTLPSGIFKGLDNLTSLDLEKNFLSQNPPPVTTFSGLNNLTSLNLGNNSLDSTYCDPLEAELENIYGSSFTLHCD